MYKRKKVPREQRVSGQAALPVARADGHPRAVGSRRGFAVAPGLRPGGEWLHTAVRARRMGQEAFTFVQHIARFLQEMRFAY